MRWRGDLADSPGGHRGKRAGLRVPRRLLLLAVAVAIVLMHHLVGAHEHHAAPGASMQMAGMSAAGGAGGAGAIGGAAALGAGAVSTDGGARAAASSAVGVPGWHVHPDLAAQDRGGATGRSAPGPVPDVMAMVMHLCLAVLIAGLALAALSLAAVLARRCGRLRARTTRPHPQRSPPHPPPVPRRLAALQILRL